MMKKHPSCLPFVLYIKNEEKHKERFAVRSKNMTIDPKFNKYVKHFKNIRIIQRYLTKKAESALVPRIDNSNVDKSISLIHVTIMRCLRHLADGTAIYDPKSKQAVLIHQEFNLLSKNQLSSRDAQAIIHQQVNKNEVMELLFSKTEIKDDEMEHKLKKHKRGTSMGEMHKKRKINDTHDTLVGEDTR